MLSFAHRAARLRAFAAGFYAGFHVADRFARIGAGVADFGALGANVPVMVGLAQHEIGAGDADLRAIHYQLEVFWLDVLAARFEAMARLHRQAGRVAVEAVLDALLHLGRKVLHILVWLQGSMQSNSQVGCRGMLSRRSGQSLRDAL